MVDHLKVEGTYNLRDLGEHVTIPRRIFIRAGNLDQLPLESQQQLLDYGVKTVIDLRDEWEAQQFPNVFAQSAAVRYLNLPLIGNALSHQVAWKEETQAYTALHDLYCKYVDRCQPQIGTIIATIAESTPTVVFHCYAGKDRTGIIAALLLGAAGVPDALIAQDYSQSQSEITHLIEQWRDYAVQHGQDMQQFERDVASDPTTILDMLSYIRRQYGGIADYLHRCGVTASQLTQLQVRLTSMQSG